MDEHTGYLTTRARTAAICGALAIAVAGTFMVARGPLRGGCGDERSGRALFERLDLDREQRAAWTKARRAHFEDVRSTREELEDLRARLRAELATASPDTSVVGGYLIEIRELATSLGAARERLDERLTAILDDEQASRYEALRTQDRGAG